MADVLAGHVQQHPHVGVGEPVEHQPALAAAGHDPRGAQQPQRLRHRRLLGVRGRGEVAHAQLTGLQQRVQQPGPGRVAEQLEQARGASQVGVGKRRVADLLNPLRVHARHRTAVQPHNLVI